MTNFLFSPQLNPGLTKVSTEPSRIVDARNYMDETLVVLLKQLDGKYYEIVQLPAKAKFGGFCRQHLGF